MKTMNNEAIESKLKAMIVERLFLKIEPPQIETDASLIDDYGVDSVSLLELVVGLEDQFGIIVEDSDFNVQNFLSVAALRDFVKERLSQ
jgi:acyl carrier protein